MDSKLKNIIFANSAMKLLKNAKKEFLQQPDSIHCVTPSCRVTNRPKSVIIQIIAQNAKYSKCYFTSMKSLCHLE